MCKLCTPKTPLAACPQARMPLWSPSGETASGARAADAAITHVGAETVPQVAGKPGVRVLIKGGVVMSVDPEVGNFAKGEVPADGQWHPIPALTNLGGCQAYEIFAHINDFRDRRFGLTYATLLMSHGRRGYKKQVPLA